MMRRLFRILTVFFVAIGVFLNGTGILAEGTDVVPDDTAGETVNETESQNTTLAGSMVNAVEGRPVYEITLPGDMVFDFENNSYSLKFATAENSSVSGIDSSKASGNLSNEGKTLRINPGLVSFPSAGSYTITVVIQAKGSESSTEIPLKDGDSDTIEIVETSGSPASGGSSSGGENNNNQNDGSNTGPSAITGAYSLAISGSDFVLTAASGTLEEFLNTYNIAFSNDGNPTHGPSVRLDSAMITLNGDKNQATFSVANAGFVDAGYHAYLANIDYDGEPRVNGEYYDLGFETSQPINIAEITESIAYDSSTGNIKVVFNDEGKAEYREFGQIRADIEFERQDGQSFYKSNQTINLTKEAVESTGFDISRTLMEDHFSKFLYGEYTAKIRIRAENSPTYTIYQEHLNIGLPPEASSLGTIISLDPVNNRQLEYVPGTDMPLRMPVQVILTDTNNISRAYYGSFNYQDNKLVCDTTVFNPVISEDTEVKNIAIAAFEDGVGFVTKANQAFNPSITIKPEKVINGTCVLEPYSELNNFKLYMICTDNENPSDQVVVNFRDNAAYELHYYDPSTPDSDINAGKKTQGSVELLTINKNSGTNMVSFDSSNINIGNSSANPSGETKKYAFVVSYTRNNMRVPYFFGVVKDSNGNTPLTLDNIMNDYPRVKIVPGQNGTEKGYFVECDDSDQNACDAYLTKYHDNEGPNNDPMYSQMMFTNPNNIGRGVRPMEELSDNEADHNTVLVPDGNGHVKLFISTAILEEIGVEDGVDDSAANVGPAYSVKICLSGYNAQEIQNVYFDTSLKSSRNFNLEFTEDGAPEGFVILKFTEDSEDKPEDYFASITNMNFNAGNMGSTSSIDSEPGGNAVIAENKMSMQILKSSIAITSGERVTAKVYSNAYSYQIATLTLKEGFTKIAPEDLVTSVKTDGVHVSTQDVAYLEGLTELNLREERKGTKTVMVDEESQIDRSKIATDHYVVFKLTQSQLDELVSKNRPDNAFWTYTESDGYVTYWNHATLSINPILFGTTTTLMNQSPTDVPNDDYDNNLANADAYVMDLNNGYSVKSVISNETSSVDLVGAVSASVASNNDAQKTLYFDEVDGESRQAIVSETLSDLDDAGVKNVMDHFTDQDYTETGTAFSVSLSRDGKSITDLAYPIQISIDEIEDGEYKLLTVHDGEPGEIKVTVQDGTAYAYSDQFSDFVLVKVKEVAPKPAPSDDSSKKSSSSGSTKKTSPVKTDNVVTCQMAGYPANYAWNESAKACQPGFIDNAGVFHGTAAVKKAGVPNTYDKGLMGNVWALMISVVTGIAAVYALKKY